ncbi:hypothetical protein [Streptomyces sp. NPDC001401]|uniref:hypothetical protein n=1 Tax=Streptomyces sp. NPDC001401 TaxID=3364570 RepID=UPI0036BFBF77
MRERERSWHARQDLGQVPGRQADVRIRLHQTGRQAGPSAHRAAISCSTLTALDSALSASWIGKCRAPPLAARPRSADLRRRRELRSPDRAELGISIRCYDNDRLDRAIAAVHRIVSATRSRNLARCRPFWGISH